MSSLSIYIYAAVLTKTKFIVVAADLTLNVLSQIGMKIVWV